MTNKGKPTTFRYITAAGQSDEGEEAEQLLSLEPSKVIDRLAADYARATISSSAMDGAASAFGLKAVVAYLNELHRTGVLHNPTTREYPSTDQAAARFIDKLYDILGFKDGRVGRLVKTVQRLSDAYRVVRETLRLALVNEVSLEEAMDSLADWYEEYKDVLP